jgi:hypothetical protein
MPAHRTPPPLRGTRRRPPPPIPVGNATTSVIDPHAPNVVIPVYQWDGRGVLPRMADGDPGYLVCIVGKCLAVQRRATALVRHPGQRTLWPYCRDHVWPYRPRKARGNR